MNSIEHLNKMREYAENQLKEMEEEILHLYADMFLDQLVKKIAAVFRKEESK